MKKVAHFSLAPSFPAFESYLVEELQDANINYFIEPHLAITVLALNKRERSVREVTHMCGISRTQMARFLNACGWAERSASKSGQWRGKKGFEHYFTWDRSKGYLINPQGTKALARTIYDLRIAAKSTVDEPTPDTQKWLACFPPRPNLMEVLSSGQDFSLLKPLQAYVAALDTIRELATQPKTESQPLLFERLAVTLGVPTELRNTVWLEFLGRHFYLQSATKAKAAKNEFLPYLTDTGHLQAYGVFLLYSYWDEEMRRRRIRPQMTLNPQKSTLQTAPPSTQTIPPAQDKAPESAPDAPSWSNEFTYRTPAVDDLADIPVEKEDKAKYLKPEDEDELGGF